MSKRATLAVEALDAAFGHETAHLTLDEQIECALAAARRMNATAADLIEERRRQYPPQPRCQHDLLKPDTTITVIDPWKAKCKVCIEFFDLPGPSE